MCRAGFPGHFGEPWSSYDGVEIDFVIQDKHLTDAGYNVLTYDIRNHGNSSDKEMIWVEKTTRRFKDGYNYFGRYPEVLAFFGRYMK